MVKLPFEDVCNIGFGLGSHCHMARRHHPFELGWGRLAQLFTAAKVRPGAQAALCSRLWAKWFLLKQRAGRR